MIPATKRSDITDRDVCEAVAAYQRDTAHSPFPYQLLAERFQCDEKLAYSACERAADRDLIEYGVSLRTGWLTEKGLAALAPRQPTTEDTNAS